jgi:O-acetyl-ADP-ribose deacetylase (regulator of RNase III)
MDGVVLHGFLDGYLVISKFLRLTALLRIKTRMNFMEMANCSTLDTVIYHIFYVCGIIFTFVITPLLLCIQCIEFLFKNKETSEKSKSSEKLDVDNSIPEEELKINERIRQCLEDGKKFSVTKSDNGKGAMGINCIGYYDENRKLQPPLRILCGNTSIELKTGDICDIQADAIMNAANGEMLGGGGIDGAIADRGGDALKMERKNLPIKDKKNGLRLRVGEAAITSSGDGSICANTIIHVHGPNVRNGRPTEKQRVELRKCHENSLHICELYRIKTLAVCLVSTGIFSYPLKEAVEETIAIYKNHCIKSKDQTSLTNIYIVCYSPWNSVRATDCYKECRRILSQN